VKSSCPVCFTVTPDDIALPDGWEAVCESCARFVAQVSGLMGRFLSVMLTGRLGDASISDGAASGDKSLHS
jgi:hypothetical protein